MDDRQDDDLESGPEDRRGNLVRPGSIGRRPGRSGRDRNRNQRDQKTRQGAEGVRPVQERGRGPGGRGGYRPLQRKLEQTVQAQPEGLQVVCELPPADRRGHLDPG